MPRTHGHRDHERAVESNALLLSRLYTERHDGWLRLDPLASPAIGDLAPLTFDISG